MQSLVRWYHASALFFTIILCASVNTACSGFNGLTGKKSNSQNLAAAVGSQEAASKSPDAKIPEQKAKVCPVSSAADEAESDDYDDDKVAEDTDDGEEDDEDSASSSKEEAVKENKDCEKTYGKPSAQG